MTADLSGHVLPGGLYRIGREENRRLCAAVGAELAGGDSAHPIYSYIATQTGMGVTVDGLLALCAFDAKDGPLLASSRTDFARPLLVEQDYRITGRILSLVSKSSRAFGRMDVLDYQLTLSTMENRMVLTVRNTWMLPRREKH